MKAQHGFTGLMFFLAVAIAVSSSPIHSGWTVKYAPELMMQPSIQRGSSVGTITGLAVNDHSACRSVLSQYGDCNYACGLKGLQCTGASIKDVSSNGRWSISCGVSDCNDDSTPSCKSLFTKPADRIFVRNCKCC